MLRDEQFYPDGIPPVGMPDAEDFGSLLESFEKVQTILKVGDLVKGTVLAVREDHVLVDIDYKSEGKIPLHPHRSSGLRRELSCGSLIEAVVESIDDERGFVLLSREKAGRQKFFHELERAWLDGRSIPGVITEVVKGGMMVDIGVRAFMPGSQYDFRPPRDPSVLIGQNIEVRIIQFNRDRRNIVVSRRALLEVQLGHVRAEVLARLQTGTILDGTVKNITDYGVFLDLGGVDGLLHKTDISWGRVNHPGDFFQLDQRVRVLVLHFDPKSGKVSLGYKQLEPDPWKDAESRFPPGTVVTGTVTCCTEYGVFAEIAQGVEGLVHRREFSWNGDGPQIAERLQPGVEIPVVVLQLDAQARRLALSVRRTQPNPWEVFARENEIGKVLTGIVRRTNGKGLLVEVAPGLLGKILRSGIEPHGEHPAPGTPFHSGDRLKVVVNVVDIEKQAIGLGLLGRDSECRDGAAAQTVQKLNLHTV